MKILCHGVFDPLHYGHLAYFQASKQLGTELIVTITASRFVNKRRLIFTDDQRLGLVSALKCVDHAELIYDYTAIPAILKHRPDIYAKGKDYANSADPRLAAEKQAVESYGGKLVIVDPGVQYSSTKLLTGETLRSCTNSDG